MLEPPAQAEKTEREPVLLTGWTSEQASLITWISRHTYKLEPERLEEVWGMGAESCQMAFTSRRYHLAFAFYATVVAFQHVPCYVQEARRILDWLMIQMLEFKSWSYVRVYWPDQPNPFDCSENVMWLGHVLAMVTLYEALLGDDQFRRRIAVRDDVGREFETTTPALAARVARAYRDSSFGGMCCEPGLVFFYCQNHALQGLYLEQKASGTDFSDIIDRWEKYAMGHFGAAFGGALQLCQVHCRSLKCPVALGHLGGDGWAIAYWAPWSSTLPERVWHGRVRPLLEEALPSLLAPLAEDSIHGPTTGACLTLDIPRVAAVSFLYAAASTVGDSVITKRLGMWLRTYTRRSDEGGLWVPEGRDWSITCTAQFLFGLSWQRGATLRSVARSCSPLQLERVDGALLLRAEPSGEGLLVAFDNPLQTASVKIDFQTNFIVQTVLRRRCGNAVFVLDSRNTISIEAGAMGSTVSVTPQSTGDACALEEMLFLP